MRLNVLNVGYPLAPVSFDTSGGAEQVVALLDRALVSRGHRSVVIAPEGSRVAGDLVRLPCPDAVQATIATVLESGGIDVVHLHGLDFARYLPPAGGAPVLVTLHLPLDWYPAGSLEPRPGVYFQCVSTVQCPDWRSRGFLAPIPNGVLVGLQRPRVRKWKYALALGRVCPEKGLDAAMDAAAQAGITLVAGGALFPYPSHQQYFNSEIAPRLRRGGVRWLGPVGFVRKRPLLAGASCVLLPFRARETSSLTAMEALAAATPVIAYPSGALTGIVRHGKTGFLAGDVNAMADAIGRIAEIDPLECRRDAEQRFDARQTVALYLDLYRCLRGA